MLDQVHVSRPGHVSLGGGLGAAMAIEGAGSAMQLLRERGYSGPERRISAAALHQRRMAQMVDEVDYGMLLVNADAHVVHLNRAARRDLDAEHPLQLQGQELRARSTADAQLLREALTGAHLRGLRRLLKLGGEGTERITLAVVPLPPGPGETGHGVVLVLGKRRVCEELTVDWYARAHSLTMAETAVVKALCADYTPQEIAKRQGVGLATIRTQIGSIRAKTGASSIRALVRQVAMLPPLVSALQGLNVSMAAAPRPAVPLPA